MGITKQQLKEIIENSGLSEKDVLAADSEVFHPMASSAFSAAAPFLKQNAIKALQKPRSRKGGKSRRHKKTKGKKGHKKGTRKH